MESRSNKKYHAKYIKDHALHPETLMMGYGYDPMLSEGALKPPVFHTSTFVFKSAQAGKSFFELAYGKRARTQEEEIGLIYSRINNPNLEVLEDRLTLWDGAEKALSFSSGMAAISTSLLSYVRPGDVVLYSSPLYGGTEYLIRNILPQFGVHCVEFTSWFEEKRLERVIEHAKSLGPIKVMLIETPANPTNCLVDLAHCRDIANTLEDEQGTRPIIMVDNTFLGPLWQRPLDFGADVVLYSLTKYVGGHSDLVAGAAVGSEAVLAPIQGFRTIMGTMCDPQTGWMILRSLETLQVRMQRSQENAKKIARFLSTHPMVTHVGHLDHMDPDDESLKEVIELYQKQCLGAGSTFSFAIQGDETDAFAVLDSLQLIKLAVSLGGTETLMEHPYSMTHADVPDDVKERLGITENLLRISVGIENVDDLIADLEVALEAIRREAI